MKRVFAAMFAAACVVGSAPGFAHGAGFAHGSGQGGFVRNPTTLFGAPAPQMPAFEVNRGVAVMDGRAFRGTSDGRVLAYGGHGFR
jgi:hypothetical protein